MGTPQSYMWDTAKFIGINLPLFKLPKLTKLPAVTMLFPREIVMAHKAQSKPVTAAAKKSSEQTEVLTMLLLDNPAALKGLNLPPGADWAIVSERPDVMRKIQNKGRLGLAQQTLVKVWTAKRKGRWTAKPKARKPPVIDRSAFEPDAKSRAILEGIRIAEEDLKEAGGAYDMDEVRTLMRGISRQAVDKRVQEGSLLTVPGPSNRRSYPTLQFNDDGTVVDGLKAVCEVLPTRNPWMILNFLAQPDDRLRGRKPIDVLKQGEIDLVVEAARRMGQQGA